MNGHLPRCFHCGAEIPAGAPIEETGGGDAALGFCCHGCHGAYLLITGAGLDDFYRRRRWQEAGLSPLSFTSPFNDAYLSRFVYPAGEWSAIDIIVDGIRCASCVWLNEKMIGKLEGVSEVRVNYATGRARVVFDPAQITSEGIFSRIAEIGYSPRPYTTSAATEGARREQRDLLMRFGTAVFLTMQLMAYSFALYAGYLQGIDPAIKKYLQLFSLLVTTPVVFYCGGPFLSGAWRSIANRMPNMDLLIALGALSSYVYSVYATITGGEVYFETAAMIVSFMLAGRLLENAARRKASGGVEHLLALCTGEARRLQGGRVETVDRSELRRDDVVLVGPGERFPVDGTIVEGSSEVDESPATGEAFPVTKGVGDGVIAGSRNLTGAVTVRCEKEAAESYIARIAALVEEAQSRRAPIQGVAERVSAIFVPAVVSLSIATFLWHFLVVPERFDTALMHALAVLLIACPCALGLATPTAIVAGTGAAALHGVIFKGGDVLERLSRVTLAAFDKTGTLTCGTPTVSGIVPTRGVEERELLALAASVEAVSLHPAAKALRDEASARGINSPAASDLVSFPGGGVTGLASGRKVAVGNQRLLSQLGVAAIPEIASPAGSTILYLACDGKYRGAFILNDRVRSEAASVIANFKKAGIPSVLLSGDREETASYIGISVGTADSVGGLPPAEKVSWIEKARSDGATVLMVGDGINDAPALSTADVGCAVAGGTEIAIETSDLVLVKGDLERLSFAHRIACRTMAVVRQNLAWAFAYNAIGIPLAMTGRLTPIYAAAAMALSSLCVVGNSLRLTEAKRG